MTLRHTHRLLTLTFVSSRNICYILSTQFNAGDIAMNEIDMVLTSLYFIVEIYLYCVEQKMTDYIFTFQLIVQYLKVI